MIPYLFVIAAMLFRLLPHPWNMTPIGAMFIFSGATFRSRAQSLLVPLGVLMLSDYAVDHFIYHGAYAWFSPYTWLGFLAMGLGGWMLRGRLRWSGVLAASVGASVAFYLISNFGVWIGWNMYPATLAGLVQCYTAALPFFRNALVGDIAWSALMFGCYFWLTQRHPALAVETR